MSNKNPVPITTLIVVLALQACGGGSSGAGSASSSSSSSSGSGGHNFSAGGPNVVSLVVGPGPTQASSFFDIPTTTITVCVPGTSTCQTITNVLVDTGSYGLRLLASALNGLPLTAQADPATSGNVIAECLPFADGYIWGAVAPAALTLGGEKASGLPIQIIDDTGSFSPTVPASCSNTAGGNIGTLDDLGANGVLGVGLSSYDCAAYCALPVSEQTSGSLYYSCNASICTPTHEALASQVINPVALFSADNNGVILQLPAIGASGATTATGYLVFGIGTESNNGLDGATVLTTSSEGFITTTFNGLMLNSSFLDSGSNGLYFPDSSIPHCTGGAGAAAFYCPTSTLSLEAINQGQNGATSPVSFQIANLNQLSNANFALDDVGGPTTSITGVGSSYFDFGLPFFYGRTVFTAIAPSAVNGDLTSYYAY